MFAASLLRAPTSCCALLRKMRRSAATRYRCSAKAPATAKPLSERCSRFTMFCRHRLVRACCRRPRTSKQPSDAVDIGPTFITRQQVLRVKHSDNDEFSPARGTRLPPPPPQAPHARQVKSALSSSRSTYAKIRLPPIRRPTPREACAEQVRQNAAAAPQPRGQTVALCRRTSVFMFIKRSTTRYVQRRYPVWPRRPRSTL